MTKRNASGNVLHAHLAEALHAADGNIAVFISGVIGVLTQSELSLEEAGDFAAARALEKLTTALSNAHHKWASKYWDPVKASSR
jgi:enamine deaminase RidA (YjgF/YER057c/UK114 family)